MTVPVLLGAFAGGAALLAEEAARVLKVEVLR